MRKRLTNGEYRFACTMMIMDSLNKIIENNRKTIKGFIIDYDKIEGCTRDIYTDCRNMEAILKEEGYIDKIISYR